MGFLAKGRFLLLTALIALGTAGAPGGTERANGVDHPMDGLTSAASDVSHAKSDSSRCAYLRVTEADDSIDPGFFIPMPIPEPDTSFGQEPPPDQKVEVRRVPVAPQTDPNCHPSDSREQIIIQIPKPAEE